MADVNSEVSIFALEMKEEIASDLSQSGNTAGEDLNAGYSGPRKSVAACCIRVNAQFSRPIQKGVRSARGSSSSM